MSGIARLTTIALDCPDPKALADFYAELTGWDHIEGDNEWVDLSNGSGIALAFQRVVGHQPPRWPDPAHPQQAHLDLHVDEAELPAAQERLLALGATLAETQPGGNWRVFTDPAGHPFCLCW